MLWVANPIGHKQQEGDSRTPEGEYILDWRNLNSRYHLSLHISYPGRRGASPGGGRQPRWGCHGAWARVRLSLAAALRLNRRLHRRRQRRHGYHLGSRAGRHADPHPSVRSPAPRSWSRNGWPATCDEVPLTVIAVSATGEGRHARESSDRLQDWALLSSHSAGIAPERLVPSSSKYEALPRGSSITE